jgi:diguanylate cyclase (GGDEF)-like protein
MLDITERHEAELALAHQATHDSMTQLLNRTSINEHLELLLSAPDRRQPIAVAFLDVDEFKQINDRVGHEVGDQALRAVAGRLRAALRDDDSIGRIGGDEFVLVRPGVNTLDDARALAEEAIAVLRKPFQIGEHEFQITASIGVTVSDEADSPTSMIRDADDAMYQAKRNGKAGIAVFDRAARAHAQRRRTLASGLRHALADDELHLEYQPILDLSTLAVAGFESLLRWNHPTLGAIAPAEFIPIAETIGLIVPIGTWVVDHAFRQLAEWRDDARVGRDLWMAVNLSAQQLGQPDLVARIARAIERAGVPPSLIHLEVTETVLMDEVDSSLATIIALKEQGVRVSIDDFGTGYSSLSYLSRLPIDTIKIDRSFLRDLGAAGHDRSIVRAMTALADALALDVVAEGIELPDQLRALRELGCGFGQGFLWSRPLDPAAALDWMIATDECSATAGARSPARV